MMARPAGTDGKTDWQTTRGERLSYGLYFAGQNLLYILVTTFTALFLLNRGLEETVVAAILLVPKIWDAVNDPLFGIIIDKARFRGGRFLPWLKMSWLLVPASTVFLFAMPDALPQGAKIAWAVAGYMLWDMSYTLCDAPIFALSTAMTPVVRERTALISFGRFCSTVVSIATILAIEVTYASAGWLPIAVTLGAAAMLLMLPILVTGKERIRIPRGKDPSIPAMFRYLGRNRYMLAFFVSYLLIGSTMYVQVLVPVFAQYVYGSTGVGTALLGISVVPMLAIAVFAPALAKLTDKFHLYVISLAVCAAASVLQFFIDYRDEAALYATTFLRAVGYGGFSVLPLLFVPDIMEYGHYLTGQRQEGLVFALQTFMTKLSAAVMTSLSLAVLGWLGFSSANADPATGVVDTAQGEAFWTAFTLVSAAGPALGLIVLLAFYKLRDRDVQLMSRCNSGEISREECERGLSRTT
jgi:Na+/melibiose symporter-like transporter